MSDITNYLSNPINAFKMIKRLTTDWKLIEDVLVDDLGNRKLDLLFNLCINLVFYKLIGFYRIYSKHNIVEGYIKVSF